MSSKKDISSLFDRSGNLTPDAMQRYIRRQLEPEEVKAVEAHLESSPFDREAMEGLQKHPSDDLQQVLAGLDERINRAAKEKAGAPVLPMKRRINWAVAAGLLALIGLTVLLVFTFRSPVNEQLAVTTPGSSISKMESGKSKIDKQSTIDNQSKIENRKSKMDNQPVGGVAIKEEKKTPINRDVEQPNSIDKNLEPGTRNLEPKVQNPEPEAENLEPGTWNQKPGNRNPYP